MASTPTYPFREVSSESNPTFRLARDLLTGRGIRKHGQALIAGQKLVDEVLDRSPEHALAWLSEMSGPPPPESASGMTWLRFAKPLFRALDVSGTHAPLLLIRVPAIKPWSDEEGWPEGCTLFVPFQDPENVGAVIRSAAAFGVSRIVLLREAAHPFHPKAVRAGGTALLQVPLLGGPSIQALTTTQAPLLALSADGEELARQAWPERFGLVAGLEGPGLPESLGTSAQRLRIPIAAAVESLNAATAMAIALYAWRAVRPFELPEPDAAAPEG